MAWLPDAIEGALIAAGVSLAGLLITNQSKVSEFRQKWIDALRDDAALLISRALELYEFRRSSGKELPADTVNQLNEATARIRLRLNPKEKESITMGETAGNLRLAVDALPNFEQMGQHVDKFLLATQIVLKKEWKRVKTGELFYRWTFRVVATGVLVLMPLVIYRNRWELIHFLQGLK